MAVIDRDLDRVCLWCNNDFEVVDPGAEDEYCSEECRAADDQDWAESEGES